MNIWMSWSSGKDSAFALHTLKQSGKNVSALFTTINQLASRVVMHAVRETLLEKQAVALSLPLYKIYIPSPCPHDVYQTQMEDFIKKALEQNVTHFAFGDLFLEDIKQYRIEQLKDSGIEPLFPLWGKPTTELAKEMIRLQQKAIVTCVDLSKLPSSFAGRKFDLQFLEDLPQNIDPCGERGEFHSFVYESPLFKFPLPVKTGEMIERDGFMFIDIKIVN